MEKLWLQVKKRFGFSNMCETWNRIRIILMPLRSQIWIGINMAVQIRIRIGNKTVLIHNTAVNKVSPSTRTSRLAYSSRSHNIFLGTKLRFLRSRISKILYLFNFKRKLKNIFLFCTFYPARQFLFSVCWSPTFFELESSAV